MSMPVKSLAGLEAIMKISNPDSDDCFASVLGAVSRKVEPSATLRLHLELRITFRWRKRRRTNKGGR